jgi:uncharacterized protein YqgC (DUF456 family)
VRNRWVSYLLIGLLFGVVDWYFLDLLASIMERLGNNADLEEAIVLRLIIIAVFISLNYGIWLVPVIPAAIYEMRQSQSLRRAAAAAVLIWVAALFSYYAFYAVLYKPGVRLVCQPGCAKLGRLVAAFHYGSIY